MRLILGPKAPVQGQPKWQALIIPGKSLAWHPFYIPLMQGLYNKLGALQMCFASLSSVTIPSVACTYIR